MVGVFVRLKARLIANGLRTGGSQLFGFVVGLVFAVLLAIVGFASLAAARANPVDGAVLTSLVTTAMVVGWVSFPVLGFGSDETLDPTRLALLPLTRRQLMTGLLAASCVGVAPVATGIALAGAAVGFAPIGIGAVLVALAAALHLALCLVLSRTVVTALSAALRSRRGRDLRILLVALVGFLPQLLRFVTVPGGSPGDLGALRGTARVLGWFPSGWAARAMASSRAGHLGPAVLEIAGLAVTIGLLLWWWAVTLDRLNTTAEAGATAPRPARRAVEPLFGGGLGLLPRNRPGAVAAREVRYSWREPRRRVALISGMLLPFIVLAGVISRGGLHHRGVVYACLLVTLGVGNRALNHFGLDGAALWVHEAAGSDLRADLSGKNVSILLTTLPVVAVTGVILAAVSGGWPDLAVAMVLAVGAIGVQLGVGNVTSVRMPVPVPDNPGNLWSTSSGQGCIVGLLSMTALAIEGLLVAPVALAVALTPSTAARLGEAIVGLVYAGGLWWAGLALADRAGRNRGPELLEAVSPRRAA